MIIQTLLEEQEDWIHNFIEHCEDFRKFVHNKVLHFHPAIAERKYLAAIAIPSCAIYDGVTCLNCEVYFKFSDSKEPKEAKTEFKVLVNSKKLKNMVLYPEEHISNASEVFHAQQYGIMHKDSKIINFKPDKFRMVTGQPTTSFEMLKGPKDLDSA